MIRYSALVLSARRWVLGAAVLLAATASQAIQITLDEVLAEERAWAGLTTKTAQIGDIKWTYSEGGNPAKPTILMLHGITQSRDNWNRVARYLTSDYHVIIPDLPMHGETVVPADYDPQPAQIVDDLYDLMVQKGVNKVHLAGHSLGGALVTYYGAKNFFNVQSVLMVDPGGVFATTQSKYLKNPQLLNELLVTKKGDMKRVFGIAMSKPPFLPEGIVEAYEARQIQLAPKMKPAIDKTIQLAGLYTPESFKLVSSGIEAPTLVIWGEEDQIIDVNVVPELMGNLKNDEPPVILKGIGHVPILEAEQLVVQAYLPFLKKADAWDNPFKNAVSTQ